MPNEFYTNLDRLGDLYEENIAAVAIKENQKQKEINAELLEALKDLLQASPNANNWDYSAAWEAARKAINKAQSL